MCIICSFKICLHLILPDHAECVHYMFFQDLYPSNPPRPRRMCALYVVSRFVLIYSIQRTQTMCTICSFNICPHLIHPENAECLHYMFFQDLSSSNPPRQRRMFALYVLSRFVLIYSTQRTQNVCTICSFKICPHLIHPDNAKCVHYMFFQDLSSSYPPRQRRMCALYVFSRFVLIYSTQRTQNVCTICSFKICPHLLHPENAECVHYMFFQDLSSSTPPRERRLCVL